VAKDTPPRLWFELLRLKPRPRRRVGRKSGTTEAQAHDHIVLSNLNRLKNFTGRFLSKFAVKLKWTLKIPLHLAYVARLPCETLMSAEQTINDKLQGSVATYLRCGGVVNNEIRKGSC